MTNVYGRITNKAIVIPRIIAGYGYCRINKNANRKKKNTIVSMNNAGIKYFCFMILLLSKKYQIGGANIKAPNNDIRKGLI